ncbi:MAG: ribonuclease Z [Nanoarchaeota archaeon]
MPEKIKITFLGTSDSVPSARRSHTAVLLTYNGENILIDCGEGTQRQFRKAKLNPCRITRILLTHKHADHSLGLVGLLKTLALTGYNKTLYIYGPRGTKEFMENFFRTFGKIEEYKIEISEVSGKFLDEKDFYLEAKSMTHGVPCNAYSFVKKGQVRIDKEKLKKFKIPSTKELKKLKEGKDIIHNGKKYSAKQLTFGEDDRKITLIYDTAMNENAITLSKNSDLLVCEATYSDEINEIARDFQHLTARQTAEIAKKAGVKRLILTHISQRYENDMNKILDEAKKIFKSTELVKDFDVVEV